MFQEKMKSRVELKGMKIDNVDKKGIFENQ